MLLCIVVGYSYRSWRKKIYHCKIVYHHIKLLLLYIYLSIVYFLVYVQKSHVPTPPRALTAIMCEQSQPF